MASPGSRTTFVAVLLAAGFLLVGAGAARPETCGGCTGGAEGAEGLRRLPENAWVHLKPDRDPVGRSYSGVGGSIGGGYVFYFGGGHGSHQGNDVELYDIAANRWVAATEAEQAPAGSEEDGIIRAGSSPGYPSRSPRGRPWVLHTYQLSCWLPDRERFLAAYSSGVWLFDPAAGEWTLLDELSRTKPRTGDVHTKCVAYDPDLRAPVYIANSVDRGVYVIDPDAGKWERKWDLPEGVGWTEIYAAYDRSRKLHVVWMGEQPGNKGWWTLDMSNGQWQPMRDLAEVWKARNPGDEPYAHGSCSLAYDVENRMTVAAIKGKERGVVEVWGYDAAKDDWSPLPLTGAGDDDDDRSPPPRGIVAWNQLVYDEAHQCFLLLNVLNVGGGGTGGEVDGLYAFRLSSRPRG